MQNLTTYLTSSILREADPAWIEAEMLPMVRAVMAALEEDHRALLRMRYLAGYSPEEVREILDLPDEPAYERLHDQALKAFEGVLKGAGWQFPIEKDFLRLLLERSGEVLRPSDPATSAQASETPSAPAEPEGRREEHPPDEVKRKPPRVGGRSERSSAGHARGASERRAPAHLYLIVKRSSSPNRSWEHHAAAANKPYRFRHKEETTEAMGENLWALTRSYPVTGVRELKVWTTDPERKEDKVTISWQDREGEEIVRSDSFRLDGINEWAVVFQVPKDVQVLIRVIPSAL